MPEKPPYWQDHRRHTPLKRSVLTVSMREGRRVRTVLRAMRVRSTYARLLESDTGYDTRRRAPDGALARLSQTTVYDTC